MQGELVAGRAAGQVGVAFRLHGRVPGHALDCIGLAGYALFGAEAMARLPCDYRLRGFAIERVHNWLTDAGLSKLASEAGLPNPGDLVVYAPAVRQTHLAIATRSGFVHADALLRRVVTIPAAPGNWQQISRWRLQAN